MKKILSLIAIAGMLNLFAPFSVVAQEGEENKTEQEMTNGEEAAVEETTPAEPVAAQAAEEVPAGERSFSKVIKEKFIEGGPEFMGIVLICLILGLAIVIERVIYLNMATTNTKKLISEVDDAIHAGGVEAAKEVCRNTSGPVASIFYQGLDRSDEGLDMVEKSVISYGGVQMGNLEKGVSWISLFIALAPMLGFMGTVIGMIDAFDAIAAANNISPAIVATGIKVALLTTVFGLIVAIILQIFYNYIISKIDSIVHDMETASISLVDMLVKYEHEQGKK
ncbi:MAG TPA: flagellar motor protein MotA [Flavobacteriales bacterium]|nr:flagellar motor protein MotA [Flavobacteriales bacterium]